MFQRSDSPRSSYPRSLFRPSKAILYKGKQTNKKYPTSLILISLKLGVQIMCTPVKTDPPCCFLSLTIFLLFPEDKHADYKAIRPEENQSTVGLRGKDEMQT